MKDILRKNRMLVFVYIVIGIFNAFWLNFKAGYFQKVVDGLALGTAPLSRILVYGGILLIFYGMNYVDEYPARKLQHDIFLDFKLMALHKISRMDYMEYQKIGTGKLVWRIDSGAEAGKNVLYGFWFRLIRELVPTILFSVYFIYRISKEIAWALLAGYVVIFLITNLLLKFLYQIKEKILNNEELLNHYLVRGFMEMLVFRMERQFPGEMRKAESAKKNIVASKVKMSMIHEAFFTIFAVLVAVLDVGILVFTWKTGSISVGLVVALFSLIENAYTPIAIFNVLYVQYRLDRTAYKRFEELLNMREDAGLADGKRLESLSGEIHVENLSFRYGEREIFHDLSLAVHKGEKVAFVGGSGSGKSTLVKLMIGLLKYEDGHIYVDEEELRGLCLDDLYGKISYLPQDSPVFDGTVRENLVFDRDVEDSRLFSVLEKVQMADVIRKLDGGLDAKTGEKGTCFSGGEKQRLALARVWFDKPDLIILDEATSAMDNVTEEAVMGEFLHEVRDKTVIAIMHRLNRAADFDRIVVFGDGSILEQGTYEELVEGNVYFQELCKKGSSDS